MLNNHRRYIIILSTLFAFSCAEETTKKAPVPVSTLSEKPKVAAPAPEPRHEVATFTIQGMDDARVKELVGALAGNKGVVEAKSDKTKDTLAVTFVPGKTNPKQILAALKKAAPDASLGNIETAIHDDPSPHKCGGCPMRDSCQGAN